MEVMFINLTKEKGALVKYGDFKLILINSKYAKDKDIIIKNLLEDYDEQV